MGLYRGDVNVRIGGRELTMAYDYAALDVLRTRIGKEWKDVIYHAMREEDTALLVKAAAAGLARHHPELTEAALAEWSPPIIELIVAIGAGLRVALWGPDGPPRELTAPGKTNGSADSPSLRTRLSALLRWRNAWASLHRNSGGAPPLN